MLFMLPSTLLSSTYLKDGVKMQKDEQKFKDVFNVPKNVFKEQLKIITQKKSTFLVSWLATQEILAAPIQMRLAEHPHLSVREQLAIRKDLLPSTQIKLIENSNEHILLQLIYSGISTEEVLEAFLNCPNLMSIHVHSFIVRSTHYELILKVLAYYRNSPSYATFLRTILEDNQNICEENFTKFLKLVPDGTNFHHSPSLPESYKKAALLKKDIKELSYLAENPTLTEKDIRQLFHLGNEDIILILLKNDLFPKDFIKLLLNHLDAKSFTYCQSLLVYQREHLDEEDINAIANYCIENPTVTIQETKYLLRVLKLKSGKTLPKRFYFEVYSGALKQVGEVDVLALPDLPEGIFEDALLNLENNPKKFTIARHLSLHDRLNQEQIKFVLKTAPSKALFSSFKNSTKLKIDSSLPYPFLKYIIEAKFPQAEETKTLLKNKMATMDKSFLEAFENWDGSLDDLVELFETL